MAEPSFKVGDKVKHKAKPEFDMVIKKFAIHWPNNMAKMVSGEGNPEYPICSYYNTHTNQFEEKRFDASELEAAG